MTIQLETLLAEFERRCKLAAETKDADSRNFQEKRILGIYAFLTSCGIPAPELDKIIDAN